MKDEAYYQSLDKRTKEYKEYKAKKEAADTKESKGLGDTIEKITEATGIKKVVELFADGKDCGCNKRKEVLNKKYPYFKPECLEEAEYNLLKDYGESNKNTFTQIEQMKVLAIYNRVFHQADTPTSCGPCFAERYNKLLDLLTAYDE